MNALEKTAAKQRLTTLLKEKLSMAPPTVMPVPAPIPAGAARMGKAQPFARSNSNMPGPSIGGGSMRGISKALTAPKPMKPLPHAGNTRKALRSGAMSTATKAMPGPAGVMAGAAARVPSIK